MNTAWQDYEQLVRRIYEALGRERGVTIECSGHSCHVVTSSGVRHQVDVLTTISDGVSTYRTAIECKHWNKKVGKEQVMKAAKVRDDARLAKAVVVTAVGFTKDAIVVAQHEGVELITLRPPQECDWEGRVRGFMVSAHLVLPRVTQVEFTTVRPQEVARPTAFCSLIRPDGSATPFQFLLEEFKERLTQERTEKVRKAVISFEPGTVLKDSENAVEVSQLTLEGQMRPTAPKEIHIDGTLHVAHIMQTTFGGKRYTVHTDGSVHEVS